MGQERRKFVRYPISISARIGEENRPGMMRDISAGGIAVVTDIDFEKESNLHLEFELEEKNFNCEGTIKMKLQKDDFIYGIAFSPQYLKQTEALVEEREKIQLVKMKK